MKKVLVVGCGGIGSELIKLIVQNDNLDITIIDFDTIELSNLNRQFLFTNDHIGKYKCQVIYEKIQNLKPHLKINFLIGDIKSYDLTFFNEFDVVYNCLDNNESREHVNLMCFLNKKKLIDGGSGGYKGQSCYFDYKNECFDCLPKPVNKKYQVCTLRGVPTKFEHCIEFVKTVVFDNLNNESDVKEYLKNNLGVKVLTNNLFNKKEIKKITNLLRKIKAKNGNKLVYDKDDHNSNQLMYKLSCIRAKSANIELINFFESQTIANNIISSICSTNSMVASLMLLSETNEVNYFLGNGRKNIMKIFPNEKNKNCVTCSYQWIIMSYKKGSKVIDLFNSISHLYSCKYLLDYKLKYFSRLPFNLNEEFEVADNTIATIGCAKDEIVKIYFLNEANDFK
nr:unnamed protein product [Papilio xuthus]